MPSFRLARVAFVALLPFAAVGCHHNQLSPFNHLHRPFGYHWVEKRAPVTNDVVWYGVDPSNGWSVYVGPDNVFYTFKHPGEITPQDLNSKWDPHDAAE